MTHNNWEGPKAMRLCIVEMILLIDLIINKKIKQQYGSMPRAMDD